MAKYDPLRDYLAEMTGKRGRVRLTFADVENLVGPLPPSARVHDAWWANDSKVEAVAWREAGWHVDAHSVASEWVEFVPGRKGGSRRARLQAGRE